MAKAATGRRTAMWMSRVKRVYWFYFFLFLFLVMEPVVEAVVTVGNSKRFGVEFSIVSTAWASRARLFLQPEERLTAIRGPTHWSSHSRGYGPLGQIPLALGSLSPETMLQPDFKAAR